MFQQAALAAGQAALAAGQQLGAVAGSAAGVAVDAVGQKMGVSPPSGDVDPIKYVTQGLREKRDDYIRGQAEPHQRFFSEIIDKRVSLSDQHRIIGTATNRAMKPLYISELSGLIDGIIAERISLKRAERTAGAMSPGAVADQQAAVNSLVGDVAAGLHQDARFKALEVDHYAGHAFKMGLVNKGGLNDKIIETFTRIFNRQRDEYSLVNLGKNYAQLTEPQKAEADKHAKENLMNALVRDHTEGSITTDEYTGLIRLIETDDDGGASASVGGGKYKKKKKKSKKKKKKSKNKKKKSKNKKYSLSSALSDPIPEISHSNLQLDLIHPKISNSIFTSQRSKRNNRFKRTKRRSSKKNRSKRTKRRSKVLSF